MKYTDWLVEHGWELQTVLTPNDFAFRSKFEATIENTTTSTELYGFGNSEEEALRDLEDTCEGYITSIELNLNIELVP